MKRPKPKAKKSHELANGEKPFDIWLDRKLHQMYDDVASEPIPEELLKLIEDDRAK
jgi:hypothetical protein